MMIGKDLAFWHPTGPHCGESIEAILDKKINDIASFGFALWSFRKVSSSRTNQWRRELAGQSSAAVLCSFGGNAVDPGAGKPEYWARQYSEDGMVWHNVPENLTSYQSLPGKDGIMASAFFVKSIEMTSGLRIRRPTDWFYSVKDKWIHGERLPSRGNHLVMAPLPDRHGYRILAILHLVYPFVCWIR